MLINLKTSIPILGSGSHGGSFGGLQDGESDFGEQNANHPFNFYLEKIMILIVKV